MATQPYGALVMFGSGPGIGLSVASLFAAKGFKHVFLISRNAERLESDKAVVLREAQQGDVVVETITADVSDRASLADALDHIHNSGTEIGAVYFNAARVGPSSLSDTPFDEVERDFKTSNIALLQVVRWALPLLKANVGKVARPAVLVTNSFLYKEPVAEVFSLTIAKAAQRALVQCLRAENSGSHVSFGLISVGGEVGPDEPRRNPKNIAAEAWRFYTNDIGSKLEVEIA